MALQKKTKHWWKAEESLYQKSYSSNTRTITQQIYERHEDKANSVWVTLLS